METVGILVSLTFLALNNGEVERFISVVVPGAKYVLYRVRCEVPVSGGGVEGEGGGWEEEWEGREGRERKVKSLVIHLLYCPDCAMVPGILEPTEVSTLQRWGIAPIMDQHSDSKNIITRG